MADSILPLGNDMTAMNALPMPALRLGSMARIDAAAENFEAMFAAQMLQPMFETVPTDSVFGGGNGEEIMRSFMLQEYGKMIAQKGILGIAPLIKKEMLRAQENAKARGGVLAAFQSQKDKSGLTAKDARYVSAK